MGWIWLFYFLGQVVHILKRADQSVGSPDHRAETYKHFLLMYWPSLTIRLFLCTVAFLLWIESPDVVTQLTAGFNLPLTLSKATAALFGYFSDSILDWVLEKFPRLKRDLPKDAPESNPLSITGAKATDGQSDSKSSVDA
jgi:hypothetical protein